MTRTRTRWTASLGAIALTASLAGCGVTVQDAAEPLPSNALPAPLRIPTPDPPASPSTSPTTEPSASPEPITARLRVWFVLDDGLAAVESSLPVETAANLVAIDGAIGLKQHREHLLEFLPLVGG